MKPDLLARIIISWIITGTPAAGFFDYLRYMRVYHFRIASINRPDPCSYKKSSIKASPRETKQPNWIDAVSIGLLILAWS